MLFAWGSYALFLVNYVWFAASVTSYIVSLLAMIGLGERAVIIHRLIFTIAGGPLPILMHWVFNRLERVRLGP